MIRAQAFTSTYLHSIAGRSHSPIPCTDRFPEWRLPFDSGNVLPDCSNVERGPGDDATLRSDRSGFVTGRLVVDS